jgi:8-oxo-dGTP diphosphatase
MQPIPTIGILIFRNNFKEVLLVKNGQGSGHPTGIYGTPAGRIDQGETPVQAAVRELNEETGLETSEKDLIRLPYDFGVTEILRKKGTIFCTWEVFVCKNFKGEARAENPETAPEWVKVSDVSKLWLVGKTGIAVDEGIKFLQLSS